MNSKKAEVDKRKSPRVPIQCPLRFRVIPVHDAGFLDASAEDVSQTGFRFHSSEFLPRNAGLLVEMNLLGHAPIRSLARTVWVRERPLGEGYEVGGIFVEPPHDARTTLRELVSQR